MPKHLFHILLLLVTIGFAGCADEATDALPAAPTPEAAGRDRAMVPLTFEARLDTDSPDSRATFTYGDVTGGKGLKTTWKHGDALGVYIKTAEGTILRAGRIVNTAGADGGVTRNFTGKVLQKFDDEGETYIYMHPDIDSKTYVNLEEMDGQLGSTEHIASHLPIVWDPASSPIGKYLGYVIRLVLNFETAPGTLKKVTLLTQRQGDEDRIFPRHYSINSLANLSDIPFNAKAGKANTGTLTGLQTSNADFTHAITLNVTGGTVKKGDDNTYTAEVYLTSSQVENLDVYNSKILVQAVNDKSQPFTSKAVSFNGQSAATSTQTLLSSSVLKNGTVRKMTAKMSKGTISPTIINSTYNISSILGMWNEYGQSYDPCGLVFLKDGTGGDNAGMPSVLVQDYVGLDIHDRYSLTNSSTGTPTFTWQLYESQNSTYSDGAKQANATCNNIDITADTEVYVSFLSEYAWNQNLLGYYHYPKGSIPDGAPGTIMKNIIFPNLSKPKHEPFNSLGRPQNNIGKDEDAPMREYMTVKLVYTDDKGVSSTTFPANTTIGFWGMIDVKANGFQQTQYSLLNWNQWRFFSNSAWNSSNKNWTGNYTRCNFFASGDICKTSTTDGTTVENIISGVAIYGFKDNVTNDETTAYSTCIFLVSASNPSAMTTHNKACFNIGCDTESYPNNIVLNKQ